MIEPSCCCHCPDARECYRSRNSVDPDDYWDYSEDGECECVCHVADQDGYTEWDDKDQPPPRDEYEPWL